MLTILPARATKSTAVRAWHKPTRTSSTDTTLRSTVEPTPGLPPDPVAARNTILSMLPVCISLDSSSSKASASGPGIMIWTTFEQSARTRYQPPRLLSLKGAPLHRHSIGWAFCVRALSLYTVRATDSVLSSPRILNAPLLANKQNTPTSMSVTEIRLRNLGPPSKGQRMEAVRRGRRQQRKGGL